MTTGWRWRLAERAWPTASKWQGSVVVAVEGLLGRIRARSSFAAAVADLWVVAAVVVGSTVVVVGPLFAVAGPLFAVAVGS